MQLPWVRLLLRLVLQAARYSEARRRLHRLGRSRLRSGPPPWLQVPWVALSRTAWVRARVRIRARARVQVRAPRVAVSLRRLRPQPAQLLGRRTSAVNCKSARSCTDCFGLLSAPRPRRRRPSRVAWTDGRRTVSAPAQQVVIAAAVGMRSPKLGQKRRPTIRKRAAQEQQNPKSRKRAQQGALSKVRKKRTRVRCGGKKSGQAGYELTCPSHRRPAAVPQQNLPRLGL